MLVVVEIHCLSNSMLSIILNYGIGIIGLVVVNPNIPNLIANRVIFLVQSVDQH